MNKAFISYSRADESFALKLSHNLNSKGVDLWIDQLNIEAGQHWDNAVQKALEACSCFVVLLSKSSVESMNVLDEITFAIENNKKIIPIVLSDCNIPLRLRRFQYIDFRGNYLVALENLWNTLGFKAEKIKPRTYNLRSVPTEKLSRDEAAVMLSKYDFYCSKFAKSSKGREWKMEWIDDNKILYDPGTSLYWDSKISPEKLGYIEAEAYLKKRKSKNYYGYSDWRIPTLEEAMSLMMPGIKDVFDYSIWTADSEYKGTRWVVHYSLEWCNPLNESHDAYVRLVRNN